MPFYLPVGSDSPSWPRWLLVGGDAPESVALSSEVDRARIVPFRFRDGENNQQGGQGKGTSNDITTKRVTRERARCARHEAKRRRDSKGADAAQTKVTRG